jgi:hypothetical protein
MLLATHGNYLQYQEKQSRISATLGSADMLSVVRQCQPKLQHIGNGKCGPISANSIYLII